MAEANEGGRKMDDLEVLKLVYADSSKNISDLKSRQWTATQLGAAAIVALAVLARSSDIAKAKFCQLPAQCVIVALIVLTLAFQLWVIHKCETNLNVFRGRIQRLAEIYHFECVKGLFNDDKESFESLRVDEGSISWMMMACTSATLIGGLLIIYSK